MGKGIALADNLIKALRTHCGPMTRRDLALATGTSKGKVTSVIEPLVMNGIIKKEVVTFRGSPLFRYSLTDDPWKFSGVIIHSRRCMCGQSVRMLSYKGWFIFICPKCGKKQFIDQEQI